MEKCYTVGHQHFLVEGRDDDEEVLCHTYLLNRRHGLARQTTDLHSAWSIYSRGVKPLVSVSLTMLFFLALGVLFSAAHKIVLWNLQMPILDMCPAQLVLFFHNCYDIWIVIQYIQFIFQNSPLLSLAGPNILEHFPLKYTYVDSIRYIEHYILVEYIFKMFRQRQLFLMLLSNLYRNDRLSSSKPSLSFLLSFVNKISIYLQLSTF